MTSLIAEAPISGTKLKDHDDAIAEIKTHGATQRQVSANLRIGVVGISKHIYVYICYYYIFFR